MPVIAKAFLSLFIALLIASPLGFFSSLGCSVCSRVHARDLGQYENVDPAVRAWVRGLKNSKGEGCCDTADGYPIEAQNWDMKDGKYRVVIDGVWYDVPITPCSTSRTASAIRSFGTTAGRLMARRQSGAFCRAPAAEFYRGHGVHDARP